MEANARYTAESMTEISARTAALLSGLQDAAREAERLTAALTGYKVASVADQWAEQWGETVPKKRAAKMLGVSVTYLNTLIDAGKIPTTPDNRVLTRAACEWANSKRPDKRPARKGTLPPAMRFVP